MNEGIAKKKKRKNRGKNGYCGQRGVLSISKSRVFDRARPSVEK